MTAPLRVAVVYPDLLGTYGDGGNGLILARRAEWRGFEVVLTQAPSAAALPEALLSLALKLPPWTATVFTV